jgi:hypothetical protein
MDEPQNVEEEIAEGQQKAVEAAETESRDAANWAKAVTTLRVDELPEGAININVSGRRVTGPVQGFGRLWRKTYRVRIPVARANAVEVISAWKENFGSFWPKGNRFYGPLTAISPGDVAVLNLRTGGGVKLSTGVYVMYADEKSFAFMTPQGHQFAAWITFSATDAEHSTIVEVEPLFRTSDPLFEIVFPIMTRMENKFWDQTLKNVAGHFGVSDALVEHSSVLVDRKRQWKMARNVWHNSAIRSGLYAVTIPVRWVYRLIRR